METFWDFKFSEYVEYLARVSCEYLTSNVLPCLTSNDSRTLNFMRSLLGWGNPMDILYVDSPALYMLYSTHHEQCATGPI